MLDLKLPSLEVLSPYNPEIGDSIRFVILERASTVRNAADLATSAFEYMSTVETRMGDLAKNEDVILAASVENPKSNAIPFPNKPEATKRSDMTLDARDQLARIHAGIPEESAEEIQRRAETVKPGVTLPDNVIELRPKSEEKPSQDYLNKLLDAA